jgi:NADH-quinone oxidoreductase subunit N
VLLLVFVAGVVLMWFSTTRSTMHEGDGPEFFTLLLVATLGMMLMVSTSNLLMLVIAVETASLSSYVLAGFRKTQRLGAEAALKYVLFGAATSGIMIYGLSLLYGMYGTLQLAGDGGIAEQIAHHGGPTPLLTLIMACIIAGLGFKISAVPLHFWCPDVFEGASTEVSAFLSVASKGAALILLMRICMLLAEAMGYVGGPSYLTVLSAILGTLGAITATVGNTAAFSQTNVKRLLAWSSIAHAGYMLCGLSLLVSFRADVVQNGVNVAVQALLIYLAVYVFMNLGAFLVAGVVERETGTADLYSFAGLGRRSPWLAAFMAVFLFSLVGLPPFAGFVAKLNLLWRLVDNGGWWWFLVGVIGVNTVFSLYYYARILRAMYLETSEQPRLSLNPIGSLLAAACALILVVLFLGFSPFDRAAGAASRMVGGPQGCVPSAVAAHQ